jgi:rod shape-determining protein MreC
MVMDHKYKSLESVRAGLSVILYPIQLMVELPSAASDWFSESLSTRRRLQEENESLRTRQLMQKAQIQKLAALEAENMRLRELLDSSFEVGERRLIAELMSVNLDPYKHQIVINKGELDDIYPGQPLLDAEGVMGQIVHAGHRLDLPYIPNNADIQPGDLLITSGLGGRFPPGYPVAVVSAVQHDPGRAFSQVAATPLAQLNRSREVLLVWPGVTTVLEPTELAPAGDAASPAETAAADDGDSQAAEPDATATGDTPVGGTP